MASDEGEDVIDDSIHCMYTLSDYTEDILGYGISYNEADRKFSVADEFISYEAFFDDKVRKTATLKIPFTHWFPAFINLKHTSQGELDSLKDSSNSSISSNSNSSNSQNDDSTTNIIARNLHKTKWFRSLSASIASLSEILGEQYMSRTSHYHSKDENLWLKTLCKLINDMLVDLMRGDQHGSLVYFEALCSFWRTLYWYVHESQYSITDSKTAQLCSKEDGNSYNNNNNRNGRNNNNNKSVSMPGQGRVQGSAKSLIERLCERLQDFVVYEDSRHKDLEPDLGHVMIIYSIMSDKLNFKVESMIEGYLFEANIRSVRWWKDKGIKESDINGIFKQSNVGRNLFIFQRLFLIDIIGMGQGRHNDRKLTFFKTYGENTDSDKDNNKNNKNDNNTDTENDNGHNPDESKQDDNKGQRKRVRRRRRKKEKGEEDIEMKDSNDDNDNDKNDENKEHKENESEGSEEISSLVTARKLDETNGKLGQYLELIQNDFKKSKELIDTTVKLWEFVGVGDEFMKFHSGRDIKEWIKLGVSLAKKKGSKYYPRRLLMAENGGGNGYNNHNNNKYHKQRREDHFISDVYGNNNNNNNGYNNEYRDYNNNYRSNSRNNNYRDRRNYSNEYYYDNRNDRGHDNRNHRNANYYYNDRYDRYDNRDGLDDYYRQQGFDIGPDFYRQQNRNNRNDRRNRNDYYGYGNNNFYNDNFSYGGNRDTW